MTEHIILVLLSINAFALGFFLYVFILTVSIRSWIKGRHRSPADLILITLALCNIMMQIVQSFVDTISFLSVDFLLSYNIYYFYGILSGASLSSSWVTAWLCTFYCIKLVSFPFQHRLVIYLKTSFFKRLPWLLSGSIVLSFSLVSLLLVIFTSAPLSCAANCTLYGSTEHLRVYQISSLLMLALCLSASVPLLLTLISLGLTITSLTSHVLRLRRGTSNIGYSQLKVHIHVAITMTLQLSLQIFYYLARMGFMFQVLIYGTILYWICLVLYCFFSPLHALILILGTRKLSLACSMFTCAHGCKTH